MRDGSDWAAPLSVVRLLDSMGEGTRETREASFFSTVLYMQLSLSPPPIHYQKRVSLTPEKLTCKAVNVVLDEQIRPVTTIPILALAPALAHISRAAASPDEASPGNVEGRHPLLIRAWAEGDPKLSGHETAEWHLEVLSRVL